MRGGSWAALQACDGGKAVAEGALLEARPAEGQAAMSSAAASQDPGSIVVVRHCDLRAATKHASLIVQTGARATAADCACGGPVVVGGQGSSLLHRGLAFPPDLVCGVVAQDGGVARELPAAAAGPVGPAAHPAAPS